MKHCEQCDAECMACEIGEPHMNMAESHLKSSDLAGIAEFNSKGHHHVLWNGANNELLPCGSERCNELAQQMAKDRSRESNTHQVGGRHYGLVSFQHWDAVVLFDLDYFQGQITKYVMRWRKKNGIEDLKKAQHFLEKYIEEIEAGRILL